jgi:hypothetical protein
MKPVVYLSTKFNALFGYGEKDDGTFLDTA